MNDSVRASAQIFIDEGLAAWTDRFIRQNVWRMRGEYDAGDLLSEAWIVLDRVTARYGCESKRHLMSLYKTSMVNRFHRLAAKASGADVVDAASETLDEMQSDSDGMLRMLTDAPPHIADAIGKLLDVDPRLLTAPSGLNRRETWDERLCRVLQTDNRKIASEIKYFLRGDEYVRDNVN